MLGLGCGARSELDSTGIGDAGIDALDAAVDVADVTPPSFPVGSPCSATAPTLLATTATGGTIDQISEGDGYVYFHHTADQAAWGVTIVPKGGGGTYLVAQNIYEATSSISRFALDGTHVTWLDEGIVKQAQKNGAGPAVLSDPSPSYYDSINLGATGFLLSKGDTDLVALDAQGTTTTLSSLTAAAYKLAADGVTLYGAALQGGLFRFDGAGVAWLGTVTAFDFALDATDIYFTEQYSQNNASVWRVAKTGGPATIVITTNAPFGGGIALSGTHIYYAGTGCVVRVGKDGSGQTLIGTASDDETIGVAVDDTCVYWGTVQGFVYAAPL